GDSDSFAGEREASTPEGRRIAAHEDALDALLGFIARRLAGQPGGRLGGRLGGSCGFACHELPPYAPVPVEP
ncbi:hypothetical protein I6O00_24630, partial [Enterobacter hormaechei]|uniref:hypothetical protein n=1 Tax=Enterobacter hormaechei TaxID=158836 RepID=UPI001C8C9082